MFFQTDGLEFLPKRDALACYFLCRELRPHAVRRLRGPLRIADADAVLGPSHLMVLGNIQVIMEKEGEEFERIIQMPAVHRVASFHTGLLPLTLRGPCVIQGGVCVQTELQMEHITILGIQKRKRMDIFRLSLRLMRGAILRMFGGQIQTCYGALYVSHYAQALLRGVRIQADHGITMNRGSRVVLDQCLIKGGKGVMLYGGDLILQKTAVQCRVGIDPPEGGVGTLTLKGVEATTRGNYIILPEPSK